VSGLVRYLAAATSARGADAAAPVGLLLLCLDRADRVGQPVLTGGLLAAALTGPHLLGPLLARRLDRAPDPRPSLAAACLTYGGLLALAAVLVGAVPTGLVAVLVAGAGLCGPLLTGGLSSILGGVVGVSGADPRRAEGWDAVSYGLAGSAGSAAVAGLAALTSPLAAVLGLAVAAGLGGVLVLSLPRPPRAPAVPSAASMRTVLARLARHGPLRRVTGATMVAALPFGGVPVLAVMLTGELGADPSGGAVLTAVFGAGILLGSLAVTARPLRGDPERLTTRWVAVLGLGLAAWAAAPGYPWALLGFLAVGAAQAPFLAATLAARSSYAPDGARAQTFVAVAALKVTAASAGTAAAGLLSALPVRPVLLGAGALVLLTAAATAVGRRSAERVPDQVDVQGGDHPGHQRGAHGGDPPVDQRTHDVAAAGQQDHRDERERDPERQHDL
jgi:hypothetical protein